MSRFGFSGGLSAWLADGRLLLVSSHHLPSAHVCVQLPSFYKDISHVGLGPNLLTLFELNYPLKALISKCCHILKNEGLGLQCHSKACYF